MAAIATHAKPIFLGEAVPNFQAVTQHGPIDFYEYIDGKWCIFFSHPADYTPVCTTELGAVSRMMPEFEKRNVKVLALSVDTPEHHVGWIQDINETQNTCVTFPIVADSDRKVSISWGMIHPHNNDTAHATGNTMTVRSVFIIDDEKKLRLTLTYPASTGRNFDEIIRVIDSLQLTKYRQVATPANWKQGEDVVIVPSVSNEEAAVKFPDFRPIKPYLRMTACPKNE
eukprot:GILK01000601.1.p1 GENE.GILK01000601.1~~GILK01000601.1.p1  ORF type:complete len:227 (+),score=36.47 GILK01000601.1:51-731(+)